MKSAHDVRHQVLWRLFVTVMCVWSMFVPTWAQPATAATARQSVVIRATLRRGSTISASAFSQFTFVVLNKHGRVIASHKLSAGGNINKRSSLITLERSLFPAGISFHLIDGTGDYFGPVILSWNSSTRARSNRLSISLKALTTRQATINLGVVVVEKRSATVNQGYGYTQAKIALANTPTVEADSPRGIPEGIGSSGRAGGNTRSAMMRATAGEMYDGMDADDDGVMNAFDINDDGDTALDHQDMTAFTAPTTGTNCEAQAAFTLFQNYKATHEDFVGTINQYGTGDAEITGPSDIQDALNNTVTFAIQRINQVCGENVTKMEFKGVSVPYAPKDYVTLPTSGFDVQWHVGARTFNGTAIDWTAVPSAAYSANPFTCDSTGCNISALDVFMQRVTTVSGKVYEFATTPSFVFMAHPMLTEVAVIPAADSCASATYTSVDYTDLSTSPAYGSKSNKIVVDAAATEKLCIKTHRPQRPEYVGENATAGTTIYNIGKLNYTPDIPNGIDGAPGAGGGLCDAMRTVDSASDTVAVQGGAVETPVLMEWLVSDIKTCFTSDGATWPTASAGWLDIDIQVTAPVNNSGNSAQKIFLNVTP